MFKLCIFACFLALVAAAPQPDPQVALLYPGYGAGYSAVGAAAYTAPSAYAAYTAPSAYAAYTVPSAYAAYTAPSAYAAYSAYPYSQPLAAYTAGYGYGSPYYFRR